MGHHTAQVLLQETRPHWVQMGHHTAQGLLDRVSDQEILSQVRPVAIWENLLIQIIDLNSDKEEILDIGRINQ